MPKYFVSFNPIEVEVEAENKKDAEKVAYDQIYKGEATIEIDDIQELEELSCSKCGKIITENACNKFGGMCGTCWADRN